MANKSEYNRVRKAFGGSCSAGGGGDIKPRSEQAYKNLRHTDTAIYTPVRTGNEEQDFLTNKLLWRRGMAELRSEANKNIEEKLAGLSSLPLDTPEQCLIVVKECIRRSFLELETPNTEMLRILEGMMKITSTIKTCLIPFVNSLQDKQIKEMADKLENFSNEIIDLKKENTQLLNDNTRMKQELSDLASLANKIK